MEVLSCPNFLLLEPTFLGVPLKNYYTRNPNFQHKEVQKKNCFPSTVLKISARMKVFLVQVFKPQGKTLNWPVVGSIHESHVDRVAGR